METVLTPAGRYPQLFLLHNPKTAGSAIIDAVKNKLGEEYVATFIEMDMVRSLQGKSFTTHTADFASAHISLSNLMKTGIAENYKIITVLREGFDRLVSHMNWMDRFNHGIDKESYDKLSPGMKRLVQQLAKIDENKESDFQKFFVADEYDKLRQLYNSQLSHLVLSRFNDMFRYVQVDKVDVERIKELHSSFYRIGSLEVVSNGLAEAYGIDEVGFKSEKINAARSNRFKNTNDSLKFISRRWWKYDQFLFDTLEELNSIQV